MLRAIASRKGISMNKVVEDSIKDAAEADRKMRLREEFARIARLPAEEKEVDFAFDAQREVVLGDE